MKRVLNGILLIVSFLVCLQKSSAQGLTSDQIKKDILTFNNDSNSVDYWKKIKTVFDTNEGQMTEHQYYLLYYMQGVKPKNLYPSLFLNEKRNQLEIMTNSGRYKKAIKIGEELVKINPVDITTLVCLSMSLDKLNKDNQNIYYNRMRNIITSILKSGNGRKPETAIKITNINDDKAIIGFTGFSGTRRSEQSVGDKNYSVWENKFGDKLYFEYVLLFL